MSEQLENIRAAGLCMIADGAVLLCKRADTGEWAFPGGHIENGEAALDAAVREVREETGWADECSPALISRRVKDGVDFTTYRVGCDKFDPALCDEHTEHVWATLDSLPEPLHPGVVTALKTLTADEYELAQLIRDGELTSPQRYKNISLFAMRITGTGASYRTRDGEFVWRDPSLYLNDDFLARCNGLAVIFEHPEKALLDSEEFADRAVGSILLPYIKGQDVWGIAKIYDDEAIALMEARQLSTSPGVLVTGEVVDLDDGEKLLIEGKPSLLDHLAICAQGVWDKAGAPSGVLSENIGDQNMADKDESKADEAEDKREEGKADADPMKAIADSISALASRMDAYEAKKADADEPEDKKADAEEEDGKAEKLAADEDEDKRADEDKAEKEKADAAMKADAEIVRKIADLDRRIPKILSDAELNEIADAQARADSVAAAFGESASRPIQGESPRAYRQRLAAAFKKHSPDWKDVDLAKVDDAVFGLAEKAIYADARAVAEQPATVEAGTLREMVRTDDTGRRIKEYVGQPDSWMSQFKSPRKRMKLKQRAEA